MNPLERLRYIARIEGEDPIAVALEATYVVADLAADGAVLVTALRRLLDRHGHLGVVWVIAARISGSLFPEDEAWSLVGELSSFWDNTREMNEIFPSFVLHRTGRMSAIGEHDYVLNQRYDAEYASEFLDGEPDARLIVESDLVSSDFAVVPEVGAELIAARAMVGLSKPPIVRATFKSLVSRDVRQSLENRLAHSSNLHSELEVIDLDGRFEITYEGDTFAPSTIAKLVEWRVPQEILRAAGPMLG